MKVCSCTPIGGTAANQLTAMWSLIVPKPSADNTWSLSSQSADKYGMWSLISPKPYETLNYIGGPYL